MENKHNAWDLAQMQSLPLKAKIQMTKRRIIDWYEYWDGQVYVSVSGGKDSQVLAHLVKSIYPDVPLVFVNTGLEFDSVREKGLELSDVVLRPELSFLQVLTKYGYPIISKEVSECVAQVRKGLALDANYQSQRLAKLKGELKNKDGKKSIYNQEKWEFLLDAPFRISNQCCNIMKKSSAHKYVNETGRKPFIGTMADESRLRKQQWIRNGCNGFDMKSPVSNPISFWTEQDILQYIYTENLQIAAAYGSVKFDLQPLFYPDEQMPKLHTTLENRTGCVFCMFGITQDTDRFIRLKRLEPKKYEYVMRGGKFDDQGMWIPDNGLGYKFVIDWLNEHGNLDIKY